MKVDEYLHLVETSKQYRFTKDDLRKVLGLTSIELIEWDGEILQIWTKKEEKVKGK